MLFHHILILECLLTNLTPKLLNILNLNLSPRNRLFLLLGILGRQLLPVLPDPLGFCSSLGLLLLLLLPLSLLFFLLALQRKLLVPRIEVLEALNQVSHGFVEGLALLIPLLIILYLNQPFDAPIRGLIGIVDVSISKRFSSGEVAPRLVESEDVLGAGVVLAELSSVLVLHIDILL